MNGFEPIMRSIVDYTAAGQHNEVYNGPVEDCEEERLRAENAKLRELVRDMWHDGMCDCDEYGACAECEYGYLERMHELGIEVE